MKSISGRDSQIVLNELASGEKLLWCNRPDAGRAARSTMGIFLFAIPWTAFAIFWVTMATLSQGTTYTTNYYRTSQAANTVAFLGIENPREVERLIEQQIQANKADSQQL